MRHLITILSAMLLCVAPAQAQTLKALMYNTNGQIVYGGTNALEFTNEMLRVPSLVYLGTNQANISASGQFLTITDGAGLPSIMSGTNLITFYDAVNWSAASNSATTRTNLGLGATWLTNTNATNFRTAIGLGATNQPTFSGMYVSDGTNAVFYAVSSVNVFELYSPLWFGDRNSTNAIFQFEIDTDAAIARTNLGLGGSNIVTFAGITNNGDIRINQTTPTNGLLYAYRTNNEPFLGLANLIASNNTTLSNETLFRVGRAEATNQAAQFGFRVVRTNNGGEGFATFSVFGYNALMMVGPSDRSRTNTATNAGIEADIYTITGSNRVMTLRDTNSGALTLHQDLGFGAGLTNTAPTNTNTPTVWLRVWVGTNNYRLPLYQ